MTLILGLILLISSVMLVQVLPNKEYSLPQFSVSFPETQVESPSQGFDFTQVEADRVREFTYDLPANVHSITLVLFFEDDLAESLPDQFRLELFDPLGNPVGPRVDLLNAPPVYNDTELPYHYEAGEILNARLNFPVGIHPDDEIVQGLSHLEVKEQVHARLEPQHRIATEGTWKVRVSLIGAGDCPDPTSPEVDRQQVLFCSIAPSPNGGGFGDEDLGNLFTIENFIYTTYAVHVEDLS